MKQHLNLDEIEIHGTTTLEEIVSLMSPESLLKPYLPSIEQSAAQKKRMNDCLDKIACEPRANRTTITIIVQCP